MRGLVTYGPHDLLKFFALILIYFEHVARGVAGFFRA